MRFKCFRCLKRKQEIKKKEYYYRMGFCSLGCFNLQRKQNKTIPGFGKYGSEKYRRFRAFCLTFLEPACAMCGTTGKTGNRLELDHKIPLSISRNLKYDTRNVQLLCHNCNMQKSGYLVFPRHTLYELEKCRPEHRFAWPKHNAEKGELKTPLIPTKEYTDQVFSGRPTSAPFKPAVILRKHADNLIS